MLTWFAYVTVIGILELKAITIYHFGGLVSAFLVVESTKTRLHSSQSRTGDPRTRTRGVRHCSDRRFVCDSLFDGLSRWYCASEYPTRAS